MIRLGLRLTLNGGRDALGRLLVTAIAVALGVGMLLVALAGINAVNSQNGRFAWLETSSATNSSAGSASGDSTADPVLWLLTADHFHGKIIGRVDVAATGSTSPVPPGISHLPGPGQFYASPAMDTLLRSTPATQLADRFAGRQIGTIGPSALPSPDSLLVVIGHTPAELAHVPGVSRVTRISTTTPSSCNGSCYFIGIDASGIDLVLSIAAAAILFPVLIFIGIATRLSAARREQRFSAVESTVAAVAGMAAGFGVFFLIRPPLATIPFTSSRFYLSDLSLNLADTLCVAIGVPLAAAVAARLALRRVSISPLGVSRRVTPKPPRAYRLIPLLAGLGELGYFVYAGRPKTTPGQIQAFMTGILLVMAGLIIAGPWLTMVGSRVMARRTSRPDVLIAARRLSDNPQAAFRSISGLVLALFVTSVAIGVMGAITANRTGAGGGPQADSTLLDTFTNYEAPGPPSQSVPSVAESLQSTLRSIPGVQAVTLIHTDPGARQDGPPTGTVSCTDLSRTPALGRCPAGAQAATINSSFGYADSGSSRTVWPAATVSSTDLQRRPVAALAVATDGSHAAIEQARTALQLAYPYLYAPATIGEVIAQNPDTVRDAGYQRLADVVILASLPIAGCSLAVSVVAGLSDRKRPFSLLRLTGAPLTLLRRVVAMESAVPLLVIAVISIGIGFLTAGLFARSQLGYSLEAPGLSYYVTVLAGLAASLALIASILPLLRRMTGPEVARND
jgi:hypothetical protein